MKTVGVIITVVITTITTTIQQGEGGERTVGQ